MSPSRPFILRPVATTLLMVGILLIGFVAYRQLPVSALPQVDYPTIQVQTFYPGASPDVMASSVTAPLERQFGQVPGLNQMTSTSSYGSSIITLQFDLDLNIDVAEQEVQASINAASNLLPQGLPNPPIYSKINPADAPVLTVALTSDSLPLTKVEDLADTTLAQKISQLSGVGLVSIRVAMGPGSAMRTRFPASTDRMPMRPSLGAVIVVYPSPCSIPVSICFVLVAARSSSPLSRAACAMRCSPSITSGRSSRIPSRTTTFRSWFKARPRRPLRARTPGRLPRRARRDP